MAGKVLVTGATGFLGSHLARALLERGEQVRALVRPGSSTRALAGLELELCEGDVTIEHTVFRALAGCDRLFHCAAVYALWAPKAQEIVRAAVEGTRCVLRAARARDLARVVYTSTSYAIGGTPDPTELDEESPWVEPAGPVYALAKRRAEELALSFARNSGLDLVVVNPCSIFGPGDSRPTPTGAAVLEVLRAADLPGLGTLVPRVPGGLNVVDVDDVARGHILAMSRGVTHERYILGGENLTMGDLFSTIAVLAGKRAPRLAIGKPVALAVGAAFSALAAATGRPPAVSYDTVRGSFGNYFWVRTDKARKELGYTSLPARRSLARAVRYYVDNGYLSAAQVRKLRLDPAVMAAG
jgi:dihydroflavonol-4-reductase